MKLGDLIELIDENTFVIVREFGTENTIASYDGRDSIPEGLNPCIVKRISSSYGLVIEI